VKSSVQPCAVPADALLASHALIGEGAYTDSVRVEVPGIVSLSDLIEAFYSSRAIQPELFLLGALYRCPASRALAADLAHGRIDALSAWRVGERRPDQILMREILSDKTRLWLMARPGSEARTTELYFGSAVLPVGVTDDGAPRRPVSHRPAGLQFQNRALCSGHQRLLSPSATGVSCR